MQHTSSPWSVHGCWPAAEVLVGLRHGMVCILSAPSPMFQTSIESLLQQQKIPDRKFILYSWSFEHIFRGTVRTPAGKEIPSARPFETFSITSKAYSLSSVFRNSCMDPLLNGASEIFEIHQRQG